MSDLERYGGRTPLLSSSKDTALFALSSGILLKIHVAANEDWGSALILSAGRLNSNGPLSHRSGVVLVSVRTVAENYMRIPCRATAPIPLNRRRSQRAIEDEYIGITAHSRSLKIARGVSMDDLGKQNSFQSTE